MKTEVTPAEPEVPRAWVRWAFVLSISTAVLSALTLALTWRIEEQLELLTQLRGRAASCPAPAGPSSQEHHVEFAEAPAPPSAPLGSGSYVAAGVDLGPVMRLRLERVRQGAPAGTVRFGSSEVLSPRAVHVISLWAPWCVACKEVLPDLRELFARRGASWGDSVRFLPVQVLDPTAPEDALKTWGPLMPPSTVQLADRSLADSFVAALRDDSRRLYQGTLPVTDGELLHAVDRTETGMTVDTAPWTNTKADGTAAGTNHCNFWTNSQAANNGHHGFSAVTDSTWTDAMNPVPCSVSSPLYCIEDP